MIEGELRYVRIVLKQAIRLLPDNASRVMKFLYHLQGKLHPYTSSQVDESRQFQRLEGFCFSFRTQHQFSLIYKNSSFQYPKCEFAIQILLANIFSCSGFDQGMVYFFSPAC